jgi:hypothetical protein
MLRFVLLCVNPELDATSTIGGIALKAEQLWP